MTAGCLKLPLYEREKDVIGAVDLKLIKSATANLFCGSALSRDLDTNFLQPAACAK